MMQFKAFMVLIVAALAATIAPLPVSSAGAAEPHRVTIEIRAFKFDPPTVTAGEGDIIVWKNGDIVPHTATAKDGRWDSSTIEPGGEWETIVTEAMTGGYYCRFHPAMTAALEIYSVNAGM